MKAAIRRLIEDLRGARVLVVHPRDAEGDKLIDQLKRIGCNVRGMWPPPAELPRDVDTVFEHPGRSTFGASVFVAARGGKIVTCAATSGYMIEYDNRHLWMKLKSIVSSHFANYKEAWAANDLIARGLIHPTLSRSYPLEQTGRAASDVHHNRHQGKVGVLCLSPEEGLGVRNPELRERHRSAIDRFRDV